jgi:dolichyl-phosphate-mannose--protein O-mannosyl transferase
MNSKTTQWIIWVLLMTLFTGLTLAGRWIDLALALTITAVVWYGIVPEPRSRRQ